MSLIDFAMLSNALNAKHPTIHLTTVIVVPQSLISFGGWIMTDEEWMAKAIALADIAVADGELPYGAVIVGSNGMPISTGSQSTNNGDPTKHAEINALIASKQTKLAGCTLYTTVEPCAMCSFIIREYQISRVVMGLRAPIMGGYSGWPILQDDRINHSELGLFNIAFAPPPEIVYGVLADQIADQWYKWNAIAAEAMFVGGVMTK